MKLNKVDSAFLIAFLYEINIYIYIIYEIEQKFREPVSNDYMYVLYIINM